MSGPEEIRKRRAVRIEAAAAARVGVGRGSDPVLARLNAGQVEQVNPDDHEADDREAEGSIICAFTLHLPPGHTDTAVFRPDLPSLLSRLVVHSTSEDLWVRDLSVGVERLLPDGGASALAFPFLEPPDRERAPWRNLRRRTASPGMQIRIEASNRGQVGRTFQATIFGRIAR